MNSISNPFPISPIEALFSKMPSEHLSDLLPKEQKQVDLFPKEQKNVYKALQEYSLLIEALMRTIEAMEEGDLVKFDALVGENFCHFRALINAVNFKNCSRTLIPRKEDVKKLLEGVKGLMYELDKGLNNRERFPFFGSCNLKDLLEKYNLEISLTAIEIKFVEFYLLTIVKNSSEKTDNRNLRNLVTINREFYDDLVKNIRFRVSEITAPQLQSLALQFQDKISYTMLDERYIRIIDKRFCPLYYPATKVMLQAVLTHKISIVLLVQQQIDKKGGNIKQFSIYYEVDPSSNSFKQTYPALTAKSNPVIVIEGISIRDGLITPNQITCHSPEHYVNLHAGSHRPHPNQVNNEGIASENSSQVTTSTEAEMTQNLEIVKYQRMANLLGCSMDHPSLFNIRHIYADLLKNVKGVKYKLDEYLEAVYGDCIKMFKIKKINEMGKYCDLNLDVYVDEDIILGDFPPIPNPFWKECYKLCKSNFVLESRVTGLDEEEYWVDDGVWEYNFINPLELSQDFRENPLKFLLDQRSDWLSTYYEYIRKPANLIEIIEFITGKPEHFQEPDAMNFLADLIQAHPHVRICNCIELDAVIAGLEKALHIPGVKKHAFRLLLHAGSKYDFIETPHSSYLASCYQIHRRSAARKVLKKFIHKEPIRNKLKAMMIAEPLVQLKMELLNMLDGSDNIANEFDNGKIIHNLSSTWNPNDYYETFVKIVEEEGPSQGYSHFYKIRNNSFNLLLNLIQDETWNKKQRIVAIRYLSNYFITYTEKFNMDEYKAILLDFHENETLSETTETAVTDTIFSFNMNFMSGTPELFTIMSRFDIHSTRYYGFPYKKNVKESERKLKTTILKGYILNLQSYRQVIFTFLIEFIKNNPVDASLRSEASSLLFLIMSHLDHIYHDGYPVLVIRNEIEDFLERYKEYEPDLSSTLQFFLAKTAPAESK